MSRNTGFRLGTVGDIESAVESSGANGASGLSLRGGCRARGARKRRGQTDSAVEADGALVCSGAGDVLSSGAVVTSLAVSIRSSEVGDCTSLASIARNASSARSTTSRRIVGSSRAGERIRGRFRAVETSRADITLDAVGGSRNAGVGDAPVASSARKLGCGVDSDSGAVVTRRTEIALRGLLETRSTSKSTDGAGILGRVVGAFGAVVSSRAFTLASVVEFSGVESSVLTRFSDIAILTNRAGEAVDLASADRVGSRRTALRSS